MENWKMTALACSPLVFAYFVFHLNINKFEEEEGKTLK
jgi:hypothetical protein